ncbi:MAG: hypothetical protein U0R49_07085 [Fimbriimonadales bacterium]
MKIPKEKAISKVKRELCEAFGHRATASIDESDLNGFLHNRYDYEADYLLSMLPVIMLYLLEAEFDPPTRFSLENAVQLVSPGTFDGYKTTEGIRLRNIEKVNARRALEICVALTPHQGMAVLSWLRYILAKLGNDPLDKGVRQAIGWWEQKLEGAVTDK